MANFGTYRVKILGKPAYYKSVFAKTRRKDAFCACSEYIELVRLAGIELYKVLGLLRLNSCQAKITDRAQVCARSVLLLVFFDCADGASVFARAAVNTFVVDYVDSVVAQGNRADGTSIRARAASNAFIRDNVCHIYYLR